MICVFAILYANAQNPSDTITACHRPKVGVVLCGGGAKGFSQIRILKALDEAGVPVDYIGGTSIGSIIGSLYAVGYDPDVMEELVRKQDWNAVIYDKIPRIYVPVEQKMYERHYLATFPITQGKIKVKSSLVDGVYVNLLMSKLMLPACDIHDFKNLPVPFFCVATDVEHATQYEMNRGILSRSVRASMSIPFLFRPVNIDDKILVDGGMVNNFPVRNMQKKGVDIIIGIDLEDESVPAEQIDNSFGLLSSLLNLSSLEESRYAKSHCDIYIKPNLHGRGTMSFNDFDSILQFGQDAADEFFPQLKRLADSMQGIQPFVIERPHVQPIDSLNIVDIHVDGISGRHEANVVRAFSKTFPAKMSVNDIEEVIVRLRASGYYENLWYEVSNVADGSTLTLHCDEIGDLSVAFAIHYDTDYGIGTLANLTLKNVLGGINRSTLSLDLNIAEKPYLKVRFSKHQGKFLRFGTEIGVYSMNMNQYADRQITNSYSIQDNRLDIFAQIVPSLTQQIRFGVVADYVHMHDLVGNKGLVNDYHFYSYLYLNYFFGNEDVPNFTRRGWRVNLTGKCVLFEGINNGGTLSSMGWQSSVIMHGNIVKSIPVSRKNSLRLGLEAGYKIGTDDVPVFYKFFVGGQSKMQYFDNIINYTGLEFIDKIVDHIMIGKLAWQWNFYKILYSVVSFDFGYMTENCGDWFDSNNFIAGGGLTLGVDTMIGPVEVSLMGSNINSRPVGFINVGFWF